MPAAVSVGTTATPIPGASSCLVQNRGAAAVFLGDASVTTANGFELPSEYVVAIRNGAGLHGIVATGTADVRLLPNGEAVFATPIP